jgi:hypothetical protein
MERRKAITTAAAASLTLLAGAAGIALNSGIVGASGDDNVGRISPVGTNTPPVTVYVDEPGAATATSTSSGQPSDSQQSSSPALSGRGDDDGDERRDDDRDEHEDDDDHDEYEGADDDD